jgi:hypothetical protein
MHSSLRLVVPVLAAVALIVGGAGCSALGDGTAADAPEGPLATVDSLVVPERVAAADTLSVRLLGTVGPNGCYSLDRLAVDRTPDRIRVVPHVRHAGQAVCTMAIVPLDETIRLAPPHEAGTLTIVVPQADRPDVTATVAVADADE